jgi:hypothetical protein
MRKWISILLVVAILMTNLSAFAEQDGASEEKGLVGTIGDFVTDAINGAGDAIGSAASDVSGLLNDAGDAIGSALNDAGDAIGNALNDAGDAIGSAASDAGNSITNALSDAGKGFLEFWKNTGEQVGDAWNWAAVSVSETGNAINNSARETLGNLRTWLAISGDNALNTLRGVFGEVASGLGMAADKAAELWDSIQRYAEARNINMVVLVKLAVAIMIRVKMKNDTALGRMAGTYIDEIVMDWFDDFNIDSDKAAAHALATLDTSLENAFQGSQN